MSCIKYRLFDTTTMIPINCEFCVTQFNPCLEPCHRTRIYCPICDSVLDSCPHSSRSVDSEWRTEDPDKRLLHLWTELTSNPLDLAVKFLREVTPYFRKASIICLEVGWELQRAFLCPLGPGSNASPPAPRSPPRADTRYIPLQLTHLARNLKHPDPGK